MQISLCLLVKNELIGCQNIIPNLEKSLFHEIFAIDAHSSDGCREYLESQNLKVLRQSSNSYNGAYLEAFKYFSGDALVFFHPKGSIQTNELLEMVKLIRAGNEFVIASRMLEGSKNEEDSKFIKHRKWFNFALGVLAKIKWGRTTMGIISDPLHGFRGLNRELINKLVLNDFGVTADLEMVKYVYSNSIKFCEYPVIEMPRTHGNTNFPAFRTGKALLKYLFRN